ncbi:hypothetical protein AAG570_006475 [Ranatra chinensis]|uniref:TBC1 domain family member 1 n=1 Tax=Ranatra chinensis TaxID=642074 RepID=A0ABD0YUR6_9HEMI
MRDQANKSVSNNNGFFGGVGSGVSGGGGTQRTLSSGSSLTALCPDISPSSSHFFEVLYIGKIKVTHKRVPDTFIDDALDKFHKLEKEKREKEVSNKELCNLFFHGPTQENGGLNLIQPKEKSESFGSTETLKSDASKENVPVANASIQEHNRTMVFHVGRNDIRLISPDRKQVLLHRYLKDITYSVQGAKHASHFAFICRESPDGPNLIGYVFKCQSNSVAEDVVTAISQALSSEASRRADAVLSCEHCPMIWYHKLCTEIEGLSEKASQVAILRRLELLPEDEQTIVRTKLQGALETGGNLKEQIELFMMILRAHCEGKQSRHVHDTPENRHEFLNHYLGGGTIFMKAKRSLTNSFDQLLKRKGSRDDFSPILKELSLPANTLLCSDSSNSEGNDSIKELGFGSNTSAEEKTGPMMNIFLKVGNSPTKSFEESEKDDKSANHTSSWRQAIFNTVVTPSKTLPEPRQEKKDKDFYKALWKKAINQQVLLIRMEKENASLTARQEEANVKRVKLEYDDLSVKENSEIWDSIISKDLFKSDQKSVLQALRQGIPKGKRGDVWFYLAEKYSPPTPSFDAKNFPNYNVSYGVLLKQLTSHQHAILIDLGRTFPSHSYYSSPLGPGQLALFNLLKAYSLVDPEVGYCQGLSFIAGILLLHVLSINVSSELNEYGVEYHVLQEEMSTPRPEAKRLKQLEAANKSLTDQNKALTQQLQLNRLESQIRSLEVTVSTLGEFITELAYNKETSDVEIPSEILRIITQLNISEQRQRNSKSESNVSIKKKQDHQFRTLSSSSILPRNQENKQHSIPPLKLALSSPNLTSKMTNLLANSGKSKNQKLTASNDTDNDNSAIPLTKSLSDTKDVRAGGEARELIVKSKSTEKMQHTVDSTSSTQENFGRVLNEADMKALGLIKDYDNKSDEAIHPLMDSEGEVRVSFEGTTKLKSIRPNRNNKLETDPVKLKIVEDKDSVSNRVKSAMHRVHSLFDSQETVLFDRGSLSELKALTNKLETESGPIIGSQITQNKTGLLT